MSVRSNSFALPRRALMERAAALGIGVATIAALPRSLRADTEVSYYTWAGYDAPDMHKKYQETEGALPHVTIFASEAEALTKVQSGFAPDIVHPCIYDIGRWRDSGVIQPIDSAKLPNWPNVFDELKAVSSDSATGSQWIVPIDWGNGSILYRTDLVDEPEESWAILFDEKYKGRLTMWNAIDGAVNAAALVAGAKNPFAMTEEELAKVGELLRKQRELVRFYWDDPAEAEQALASGEVVAAYTWNQSEVNLKKQGVPVKYARPKEGILTWVCGLVMTKSGEASEEKRYAFINDMLDTTTGQFLIDVYGYGHSNRESFKAISETRLAELGLPTNPAEMFEQSVVLGIMDPAVRIKYTTLFEEIRAGQ